MSKSQQNQSFASAKALGASAAPATQPIASTAGTNEANANQTASTAYTNEAQTGGFTPQQQQQYLNQATSQQTAAGNVEENQAALAAAKTGQGNPQAAISRIARQVNQGGAQALNNAQVGMNTQINQNKLAGAGGEAALAGQSAQQQMAALGLQFSTEEQAQAYMNQIANAQKGPLANVEQIGSLAAGGTAGLIGATNG